MKLSSRTRSCSCIPLLVAGLTLPLLPGCGSGGSPSGPPSTVVSVSTTSLTNPPAGYSARFQEMSVPASSNEPFNPPAGSWPDDLIVDTQGTIWFAEHHSNEVGSIRQAGSNLVYRGYPVTTGTPEMDSIAIDSTRQIAWVTENAGNKVVRLDFGGSSPHAIEIDARTTDTPNPVPGDIRLDANGTPWLTEGYEGDVGSPHQHPIAEIDPATNKLTEVTQSPSTGGLDGITFDSSGALWYVELDANKIVRFVNGQSTEFALPRPNVIPTNIAIDSNGLVWVTEQSPTANAIAVLNPNVSGGAGWRELPVPTPNSWPAGIVIDGSNNVWFTEFNSSKIGLVPAGSSNVVDFAIPTPNSGPEDVFATPDGRIFFTEQYGNKIGQLTVTQSR